MNDTRYHQLAVAPLFMAKSHVMRAQIAHKPSRAWRNGYSNCDAKTLVSQRPSHILKKFAILILNHSRWPDQQRQQPIGTWTNNALQPPCALVCTYVCSTYALSCWIYANLCDNERTFLAICCIWRMCARMWRSGAGGAGGDTANTLAAIAAIVC